MKDLDNKIIMDSLHGYISIPTLVFDEIIDTPIFQRLKRIEQTSMRPLYPSAHHDRFIHSLGVYYLGEKALECLKKNSKEEQRKVFKQYGPLFKLACLLHDCAHAPFSHSFEKYYLGGPNSDKQNEIKKELKASIQALDKKFGQRSQALVAAYEHAIDKLFEQSQSPVKQSPVPHEVFSAIIVAQYYSSSIKKICDEIYKINIKCEDIEFIQRAILGLKYDLKNINKREKIKYSLLNCLIQLLNSKSVDVDKLDYIMRDSAASGNNNLSVDVERILNALTIIEIHEFKDKVEIEEEINNSVVFNDFSINIDDLNNRRSEVNISLADVNIDGGDILGIVSVKDGYIEETDNNNNKYSDNNYHEFAQETKIRGKVADANIVGNFTGKLSGDIDGVLKCKIKGTIKGKVIGPIEIWKNKGELYYEIGYKQSALSVIEDTIIARNRLYMWIYAHHKVTYIDYLLRNAVLVSFLNKPSKNQLLLSDIDDATSKIEEVLSLSIFTNQATTTAGSYYLLDDNQFMAMIVQDIKNGNKYAHDYISRTKSYSIWKNYAEYNMFFGDLSSKERATLWDLLFGKTVNNMKRKEGNSQLFSDSILNDFEKTEDNTFVWIKPSGYKISKISSDDTYLLFRDSSVRRLKDVMIKDRNSEQYVDENYFYLYSSSPIDAEGKAKLINFLKTKVRAHM